MSFTGKVKGELAALPLAAHCCVTAELGAFILGASVITLSQNRQLSLGFRTENAAVLRRALLLFNQSGKAAARPRLLLRERMAGRRQYILQLSSQDSHRLLRDQGMLRMGEDGEERFSAPQRVMRRNCCRRSYVRGAFLACGYIAAPRKRYHAEWVYQDRARALRLKRVLGQTGLYASLAARRGNALLVLGGGDQVSELLKIMGASLAVLSLENTRAEKNLKESVNRAMNCDHANMNRQLSASARQIAAIETLSLGQGLATLPPRLEALARLRLSQPDATLFDLGQQLDPPLTKSGVQHQMRDLLARARALCEQQGRTFE
jgi:DNA-binding protein WhiA